MKAVPFVALLLLCSTLYPNLVKAQNSTPQQPQSKLTAISVSENNGIIRIPAGALQIEIDDEKQPFRLQNLDRRFDSVALIKFLEGYVVNSRHVTIIITSITKREVEGEQEFNKFLEQLGKKQKALVVLMPLPTGDDPDIDLRKFAETFPTQPNKDTNKTPRTNR